MGDIERFNRAPYYELLGMRAESCAPGAAIVRLPFDAKLTQLYDAIHDGVVLTLADASICVALATLLEESQSIATVQLSLSFLAPAGQSDLVAEGTVTRRGRKLAFGECVIRAGETDVARGHAVCRIAERSSSA